MNRYYIAPDQWSDQALVLRDEEAHHCSRVMRAHVGQLIKVFNGEGKSAEAEIIEISKDAVTVKALAFKEVPKSKKELHLLQAIPKGKLMDWIVQKSVELGVSMITPLITANTVVRFDTKEAKKKQEKWQRVALEACKQCGQDWLPIVQAPQFFGAAIEKAEGLRIIASLAEDSQTFSHLLNSAESEKFSYLIGPEGDFSSGELELAREQGFQAVTLGKVVLRVETASMFGLSILRNHQLES